MKLYFPSESLTMKSPARSTFAEHFFFRLKPSLKLSMTAYAIYLTFEASHIHNGALSWLMRVVCFTFACVFFADFVEALHDLWKSFERK